MFIKNLEHRSNIREYLFNFYRDLSIPTTIEQIIILSSTINQLTSTSSEWTQISLVKTYLNLFIQLFILSR